MNHSPTRIALWSGPRDVATALLYSFAQRDDATVSDEPLFGYYLGFTGIEIPFREEVIKRMEIDPARVIDMLVNCDLNKEVLFVKSKSDQVVGIQWDFMPNFKNVFLISSPERMILANDIEKEEQELIDTCYEVQYQQMLYLIQHGIEPIVIDTDDLLKNYREILPLLCRKLNVPYQHKMMSWEKGEKSYESLPSKNWCQHMHQTTDFSSIPNHLKVLSKNQQELAEECMPFYNSLKKYAI